MTTSVFSRTRHRHNDAFKIRDFHKSCLKVHMKNDHESQTLLRDHAADNIFGLYWQKINAEEIVGAKIMWKSRIFTGSLCPCLVLDKTHSCVYF